MWNIRRILVALDLAERAPSRALDHAVQLAAQHNAALTVLYVSNEPVSKCHPNGSDAGRTEIERLVATEQSQHVRITVAQRDPPAPQAIVRAADEIHADLIVMGTRRRSRLGRAILGGVTVAVIRSTKVPVLIVRAEEGYTGQMLDAGI
jgi:nucleotide-binding universal stress UspA family protein